MLENMYLDSLSLFEMAPGGVGQPVSQALLARQERALQMQTGKLIPHALFITLGLSPILLLATLSQGLLLLKPSRRGREGFKNLLSASKLLQLGWQAGNR